MDARDGTFLVRDASNGCGKLKTAAAKNIAHQFLHSNKIFFSILIMSVPLILNRYENV